MTKKKRAPKGAMNATRCPHCDELRLVAPVQDWQLVNFAYPLPGMFSFLRDAEHIVGPEGLLVGCIPCGCFQPVGVLRAHARGHSHAA